MMEPARNEDAQPPLAPPPVATQPTQPPIFNLPSVVVWLIGACVSIHLIRAFVLTPDQDFELIVRFAFVPVRYSGDYLIDIYAFAGPVTYAFLHGNIAHLAVNVIWLAAFGSPLANRIGTARFLLFWLVTSLAAVGLHYILHLLEAVPLVGASGAISGMMGAAARFAFRVDRTRGKAAFDGPILGMGAVLTHRGTLVFLIVWMAINLAMGLGFGAPSSGGGIAWEAHIGGFLAGFFLLRLFDRPQPPAQVEEFPQDAA
jgi:membrane associated rhomboid family serine protease